MYLYLLGIFPKMIKHYWDFDPKYMKNGQFMPN